MIAKGRDGFDVDTSNPFAIRWVNARTAPGKPFVDQNGLLQEDGVLHFTDEDHKKPGKMLRVHPDIEEMRILGAFDGDNKPVGLRVIPRSVIDQAVAVALKQFPGERDAQDAYVHKAIRML